MAKKRSKDSIKARQAADRIFDAGDEDDNYVIKDGIPVWKKNKRMKEKTQQAKIRKDTIRKKGR